MVHPTDAGADAIAYTKFVAAVKREMRELSLETGLPANFDQTTRTLHAQQQQAIDRQSDLVDRMFEKMNAMLQQVADDSRAKQAELEEQFQKHKLTLENDFDDKKAKLDAFCAAAAEAAACAAPPLPRAAADAVQEHRPLDLQPARPERTAAARQEGVE
jgi:hypothetical protein